DATVTGVQTCALPILTLRTGPPTATVTAVGSGFRFKEGIEVTFDAIQLASVTSSSTGSFQARFRVPQSAQPGRHKVTATGQTSKIGRASCRERGAVRE